MIGLAFAALQLAVAAPSLVVRDANRSVRIATVASPDGPMLRPEALAEMLPITVHHDSSAFYTLDVFGARLQLEVGRAVVRIGADVRLLASAPVIRNGQLMIPLQLVSDVFPATVPNARWDPDTQQLVVFSAGFTSAVAKVSGRTRQSTEEDAAPSRRPPPSPGEGRLPPVPAKHNRWTVIVDAGHGGVDNGMSGPIGGGPRIVEKTITLDVATRLGEQLRRRGLDVVYTRTRDTLIALDDRGRIANRANGDLFISIHVNAANPNWKDPGGSRGFETYFLSDARTDDARRVEKMENSAVRFEKETAPHDKGDPLSFILTDMRQNEHLRESSELADMIQKRLATMHPGPSRGVKQAGFRVLVTAYMPAVLVEIGFGTNPREAAYISDPDNQDAIATAVTDAAMAYLRRYEGRVSGTDPAHGVGARR